jgi:hypothetical protein
MSLSCYAPSIPTSEPNNGSKTFGIQNMAVEAIPIACILIL